MKQPKPINTAHLLKSWRAELGISQSAAAKILAVNLRTYQGWEAGKPFRFPQILKMALTH